MNFHTLLSVNSDNNASLPNLQHKVDVRLILRRFCSMGLHQLRWSMFYLIIKEPEMYAPFYFLIRI